MRNDSHSVIWHATGQDLDIWSVLRSDPDQLHIGMTEVNVNRDENVN